MVLLLELALVALLGGSIVRAFFGRPPRHRARRWAVRSLLTAGAIVWVLAVVATVFARVAGIVLLVLAVEVLCLAVWLARGARDDGDDGGGGGGGGGGDEPPPGDWGAFDRARRGWGRPREPVA